MISGALLLKKEETAKELFQKRVSRIAAAIVLFSFLQYGVDWARGREGAFSLFVFLRKILAGDIEETYWFLYAYLGILLLLPLVRRLARAMTDADFRYLLALETALAVGLPLFGALTGLSVSSWLFVWNTNVFYLLAGFWLSGREEKTAEEEKRIFVQSCLAAAVVIGLSCVVVWLCYEKNGQYAQRDLDFFTPLLAMAVFSAIRSGCAIVPFGDRAAKAILCLGSCSFGIYLTEQLVRIVFLPVYRYLTEHSVGILACTVYVAATYAAALVVTLILKRIPGIKRIL